MDIKTQEQVNTEQENVAEKIQLLEIYKLHAQLVSDISNRLTTTNRFYPALMSGLLAFFFAALQRFDVLFPSEIENRETLTGISIIAVGYLGSLLSLIWFFSIRNYYRMISKKHDVLLELEVKLEFHFFEKEWRGAKGTPYRQLSFFENAVPYGFSLVFLGLVLLGVIKTFSG